MYSHEEIRVGSIMSMRIEHMFNLSKKAGNIGDRVLEQQRNIGQFINMVMQTRDMSLVKDVKDTSAVIDDLQIEFLDCFRQIGQVCQFIEDESPGMLVFPNFSESLRGVLAPMYRTMEYFLDWNPTKQQPNNVSKWKKLFDSKITPKMFKDLRKLDAQWPMLLAAAPWQRALETRVVEWLDLPSALKLIDAYMQHLITERAKEEEE